jgi:hypothetical protein
LKRSVLNLILAAAVLAAGISLWLARGHFSGRDQGEVDRSQGPEPAAVTGLNPVDPDPVELGEVRLRVLNATEVRGLAGEVALLIPGLEGCVVDGVGNAPRWQGSESLLINRRLEPDRAAALARLLGGLVVIPEWDDRTQEDAVLILSDDYQRVHEALKGQQPG